MSGTVLEDFAARLKVAMVTQAGVGQSSSGGLSFATAFSMPLLVQALQESVGAL